MRYIILLASVVIQACLGGLYTWSSFVPELTVAHGLTTAQTQLIFGVLIAVFTLSMVPAGRLLERVGPRPLLITSGVLFAAGYIVASYSSGAFWLLLLGIGGVVGLATGVGYVCPLATCIKWFPAHKGLVTGVAVAGFGGGAILLAGITELALARGMSVLMLFRWMGICYGIAILAAGMAMRSPHDDGGAPSPALSMKTKIARDPFFWALVIAMFCGTFAGLLSVGNLKPMALSYGVTPSLAAWGVVFFAVGNAAGRLTWGWIVDIAGARCITASMFLLAGALAALLPLASHPGAFHVVIVLIGFGFGACFVIHAALVASRYGADHLGDIYPLIFLAYGAAALAGPPIGGWLHDLTDSYDYSIGVGVAVVIMGLFASGWFQRRARPV